MENKVGDKIPSEKELASILEDIRSVKARVAKWGVHLTADERQTTVKLRAGAEELAGRLTTLAEKHSVAIKGMPLAGMNDDLKVAKAVRPIAQALEEVSQLVADTQLEATSEAAQAFYAYYSRLSQMAETDAELLSDMAPLTALMATARRRKP